MDTIKSSVTTSRPMAVPNHNYIKSNNDNNYGKCIMSAIRLVKVNAPHLYKEAFVMEENKEAFVKEEN